MGYRTRKGKRIKKREGEIFGEIGRSGLKYYGGYISEEWNSALVGSQGIENYKRMSTNDPVIAGMLYAVDNLCTGVPWYAKPAGSSKADQFNAWFLESCIHDMSSSWPLTVAEILTEARFGWSYLEIIYKLRRGPRQTNGKLRSRYSDGLIGWRKWAPRAQDTLSDWIYEDGTDTLKGMLQVGPPDYIEHFIPIEKALLFRTTSVKGNPEGQSLLRGAYRPWYLKTNIEDIEGYGMERDLAGFPTLYLPGKIADPDPSKPADVEAHNDWLNYLTNIKRDLLEGLILPSETDENGNRKYELKLLASGGTRQFNTSQIINRYNTNIAITLMADFLLLGQQRQGSYALSETKATLFNRGLTAIVDGIAATVNTYAVPRLFDLNPSLDTSNGLPELAHGKIETPSLSQLAEYINKLSGAGISFAGDLEVENHLRGQADLPLRKQTDQNLQQKDGFDEDDPFQAEIVDDDSIRTQKQCKKIAGKVISKNGRILNISIKDFNKTIKARIYKTNPDKHIVCGVVSEPETVDAQGDVLSAEEIAQMAEDFERRVREFRDRHTSRRAKTEIIASRIVKRTFWYKGEKILKGSWLICVRALDAKVWNLIKAGIYRAFSIGGEAKRVRIERRGAAARRAAS